MSRGRIIRSAVGGAVLSSLLFLACDQGMFLDPASSVSRLELVAGDSQEFTVGEALPEPIAVRVLSRDGDGVQGVNVTFRVVEGDGTVSSAEVYSDASGSADVIWTLGPPAGEQVMEVGVEQVDDAVVYVKAKGKNGPPERVSKARGDKQKEAPGDPLAEPLVVEVEDRYGNPVPHTDVRWSTSPHGGSFDPEVSYTDSSGAASTTWTLGSDTGTQSAEAKVKGTSTTFTATAAVDRELTVVASPATKTLNAIGDTLLMDVRVLDAAGSDVTGDYAVAWSSTAPAIADVDGSGRVWSRAVGVATIIAAVSGGPADTTRITVRQVAAEVQIDPSSASLASGETLQFRATATDSNAVTIDPPGVNWSSSNSSIAAVDGSGRVAAYATGSVLVWAGREGVADSATVTVTEAATSSPPPQDGLIPAFPGAEGFGATALNTCRTLPLAVHFVTNTNATGAGSYRDILENRVSDSTYDIVIFRVAGDIFPGQVYLKKNCVYLAGQTAPGGVQIRTPATSGYALFMMGAQDMASDVVVRYLRYRTGKGEPGTQDVMAVSGGHRIIFDHVSAAFGNDEVVSFYTGAGQAVGSLTDITVSNTIVAAGLRTHSTGSLMGTNDNDDGREVAQDFTLHHNLYIHNAHRNPLLKQLRCAELVNNVIYNWRNWAIGASNGLITRGCADLVGNTLKAGPWGGTAAPIKLFAPADAAAYPAYLHLSGNAVEPLHTSPPADQKQYVVTNGFGPAPDSIFTTSKQALPAFPVMVSSAASSFQSVLAQAGASQRLACDGSWVNARDALDQRFVSDALNGTGPSSDTEADHPDDYGGFPTMGALNACPDSDRDGMPDAYEDAAGLDRTRAADAGQDADGDGYLNIEEYLNGSL